jgi:hypothetical protein
MLPKQENYQLARQLALETLRHADLRERAACGGGVYRRRSGTEERIELEYLGRNLRLSFPQGAVESESPLPPSLREEIVLFHYLEKTSGGSPTGDWISFAEIPGGAFYTPVFLQRCKTPLVTHFGTDPEALFPVAQAEVGGIPGSIGEVGVRIQVFPQVPLGLALWKGDSEFPPEGNVLFDSSIPGHLPVEDIVILAETVVWRLIKKKDHFSQRAQSSQRKEL